MTLEERRARIKDAGLRVPWCCAWPCLTFFSHHQTADMVVIAVEELGSISKQAIYDALTAFTQAGILRRQVVEGGGARYERLNEATITITSGVKAAGSTKMSSAHFDSLPASIQ